MKYFCFLIAICSVFSCTNPVANTKVPPVSAAVNTFDTAYTWVKLADSAGWKKSYNFHMFSIRDSLWVFHSDGCWFTADGVQWQKSALPNVINNLAFLDYVYFKNAVYGLGYFNGNIEKFDFKPIIYRTSNNKTWDTVAMQSNLPPRFFYHPFVFNDKLWIVGGEDQQQQFADVWSSDDAVHWTKHKDNLPFGKRSGSSIVELNGKLFLIGKDVWSSTDALNWTEETNEILAGEKDFYPGTAIVFDNKIWLLGCNRNGRFKSQVFVSANGKAWKGEEAPWSPRGGVAAAVFKNRIYLTGGKYGGLEANGITTEFIYSNDIWMLQKK